MMYVSCALAPVMRKLGEWKMLNSSSANVSLHSSLILFKPRLLDIRMRETACLYEVKHGKYLEGHVEIVGCERTDELARLVALNKNDKFLLSHAKKVIRAANLKDMQSQYADGSMDEINKCSSPQLEQTYKNPRQIKLTSQMA
ncbi:hypothetical protein EVAR_89275_1 [Eumeta japonica]|uniref:Uncharacterized protein n=1 Tax=Eumeta variegata TaxID=151549 RepID=A0A4C1VKD1_EUMVA|nr:hypothetical protein EVAR_89275_1 [Eumeta japonica]